MDDLTALRTAIVVDFRHEQHLAELRARRDAIAAEGLSKDGCIYVSDIKQFWEYLELQREIMRLEADNGK